MMHLDNFYIGFYDFSKFIRDIILYSIEILKYDLIIILSIFYWNLNILI